MLSLARGAIHCFLHHHGRVGSGGGHVGCHGGRGCDGLNHGVTHARRTLCEESL